MRSILYVKDYKQEAKHKLLSIFSIGTGLISAGIFGYFAFFRGIENI